MNARTQSFVLLLFGGALLRLSPSDALLRYVRPVSRRWVFLAALAFIALALWGLVAGRFGKILRPGDEETGQIGGDEGADAHGHSGASRAGWLVLAPVVAILVIAPPALGSFSASRVPATVAKPASSQFAALPKGNPVPLQLIDFAARAVWDDGRTLTGHDMALTGFVLRADSGGFVLSRLVITCCAADARPIDIGVRHSGAAPAVGTWVTVTGGYGGVAPDDATLPLIDATTVTVIRPPTNPYDD